VSKRNSLVWQRRTLMALVAAVCSVVIGLIWHPGEPTSQAKLVSEPVPRVLPTTQSQGKVVALDISGLNGTPVIAPATALSKLKAANGLQLKAFKQEIVQVDQPQDTTFSLPKEFQGKTIAETTLSPKQKVIALTFDDGPWPRTTEQVLEILKQNNIKATFFWIGKNLKNSPQIGQLVVDAGHAIGNHTWHHWYHWMDAGTASREIEDTAALIYETTGVKTSLFRPPGGFLTNGPAGYAKQKNYAVMMWSADSRDWFYRLAPAQVLVNIVLREAKPGGIVLMHDGGGDRSKTVKALPQIIDGLKQRGYEFVTVPELLEMKDQELKGPPEAAPAASLSKLKLSKEARG